MTSSSTTSRTLFLHLLSPLGAGGPTLSLALVGVRSGLPASPRTRNEVLTTVRWGYDIVIEKGVPTVRLNRIARGVDGGSASFRRTLSQEITQGSYPTHCFVGSGWGGSARCA